MLHDAHRALRLVTLLLFIGGLMAPSAHAQTLTWRPFETALAVADSTDRPVLVDVYAPWCGWCRKMKRDVYPSERVRSCLAEDFVLTRLNRDDTDTAYQYRGRPFTPHQLAQAFGASAVPAVVLLAPDGGVLVHLPGFIKADALQPVLAYIASGGYRHQTFEAFRAQRRNAASCCAIPDGCKS